MGTCVQTARRRWQTEIQTIQTTLDGFHTYVFLTAGTDDKEGLDEVIIWSIWKADSNPLLFSTTRISMSGDRFYRRKGGFHSHRLPVRSPDQLLLHTDRFSKRHTQYYLLVVVLHAIALCVWKVKLAFAKNGSSSHSKSVIMLLIREEPLFCHTVSSGRDYLFVNFRNSDVNAAVHDISRQWISSCRLGAERSPSADQLLDSIEDNGMKQVISFTSWRGTLRENQSIWFGMHVTPRREVADLEEHRDNLHLSFDDTEAKGEHHEARGSDGMSTASYKTTTSSTSTCRNCIEKEILSQMGKSISYIAFKQTTLEYSRSNYDCVWWSREFSRYSLSYYSKTSSY